MASAELAAFIGTLSTGSPIACGNLTVVPLYAADTRPSIILTLDEALELGRVDISEVSEAGMVPELRLLNRGDAPILLLDGEELVGAKQNRILNTTILAPPLQAISIPVSCVEVGRWDWRSRNFSRSNHAIYAKLRKANSESVSESLRRRAGHRADQAEIWASIASKSDRMGAFSETGAAGAMFERHDVALADLVDRLSPQLAQVGAAFLINGRLAGLDVFSTPDLYARLCSKLVRSYGLDALDDKAIDATNDNPLAEVAYVLTALRAIQATLHKSVGLGDDIRFSGTGVVGAALAHEGHIPHLAAWAVEFK